MVDEFLEVTVEEEIEHDYKIRFDNNGGIGTMKDITMNFNVAKKLTANTFKKENYCFKCWNTQSDGSGTSYEDEELVNNLTNTSGDVITLYAIYDCINYVNKGPVEFDGTKSINTEMHLFSERNINKNFEISFEISDVSQSQIKQATIVNSMEEVSPYPGFVFRIQTNGTDMEFNAPKIGNRAGIKINTTNKITMKRINDIYYIQVNDGNMQQIGKYSEGKTFDEPLVLGQSSNTAESRYFKGTLSNISARIWEQEGYTVVFDANGGTGTMDNQIIRKDETINLSSNTFESEDGIFDRWNTKPDGSGTNYTDEQVVTNLALPNESITLYAQWEQDFPYSVRFNSNGGTGIMANQNFVFGTSQNLSNNMFTKENGIFMKWNTKADGSGTDYSDGQKVKNLTKTENGIIDLYAIWSKKSYMESEYMFDGTNYIDTGVYLFEKGTITRDFEISFEIVNKDNNQNNQATFISAMDETGDPWPGIVYRFNTAKTKQQIGVNANERNKIEKDFEKNITKIDIKRTNGVIYLKLDDKEFERILDISELDKTFHVPLTFGASLDKDGVPQRQFKGKLSNLYVEIF